jgi:transcriptional regulator with XRE-family HTH domain
MRKKYDEPNDLRRTLSQNIKKQRKIIGLTQEKLAEATELSYQTINDIEGCRMWVSDKTILKLAKALHIDPYQLFEPASAKNMLISVSENINKDEFLLDLESKIIKFVKQQFADAKDILQL